MKAANRHKIKFSNSEDYWESRYQTNDNSGDGSYGKLATFKSEVLNNFVEKNGVDTVIELGCGDGNQLTLAKYPDYIGFDVSQTAIDICRDQFEKDPTKNFLLLKDYNGEIADLSLSLDVIYHLIEDEVFEKHMDLLFKTATKFVGVYASDTTKKFPLQPAHIKHRKFSEWIAINKPDWKKIEYIPNPYPYNGPFKEGSFADFYFYAKN